MLGARAPGSRRGAARAAGAARHRPRCGLELVGPAHGRPRRAPRARRPCASARVSSASTSHRSRVVLSGCVGLEHRRDGAHRLPGVQPGHAHAGGVPTLGRDLLDAHPDDIAAGGEHEYLIVGRHGERGHHRTPGRGDLHAPHALAARP